MKDEYKQLTGIELTDLIQFDIQKPALDSILIDCADMDFEQLIVKIYDVIYLQNYRMIQMNVKEYNRAIVSDQLIIDKLHRFVHYDLLKTKPLSDKHIDNTIYIIIKSIDNREIIHPPYLPNGQMMSWTEYKFRLLTDKPSILQNDCPYLQARFTNVQI